MSDRRAKRARRSTVKNKPRAETAAETPSARALPRVRFAASPVRVAPLGDMRPPAAVLVVQDDVVQLHAGSTVERYTFIDTARPAFAAARRDSFVEGVRALARILNLRIDEGIDAE